MMHVYSWRFQATAVSGRCDWDSEQTKLGITILLRLPSPFIQWFGMKSMLIKWFGMKSWLVQNAVFWPHFMFIKVRNYLSPNFTKEDIGILDSGPPANYVYGCHLTPVTRGALGHVAYQKGIIQGHFVHRYASRRAHTLCSRIVFRTVLSFDVST